MKRKKLKERRIKCGFTQGQLAGLVGISRSHYNMIERGTRGTTLDKWLLIAQQLNIPANEIISYATEKGDK